jgi:hypothetical protein
MATNRIKSSRALLSLVLLFVMVYTSACGDYVINLTQPPEPGKPQEVSSSAGHTWIEFPIDGQTYPMEPMPFAVYAADGQGVTGIELWVNGVPVTVGAPHNLSDAGNRLVRLDQVWLPQAEGTYVLQASSRGTGGLSEAPHITFCIVTCRAVGEPVTSTEPPTPATGITITPEETTLTPTITPTGTVTVYPTAQIEFWASPPYANAGQCTTLNWNVSGAKYVYLDGNQVNFSGSQQVCPCQTTTYTLSVYEMDGTQKDNKVTVIVSGSCQPPTTLLPGPPPSPPTWAPPTTEPPTQATPQDTTGPSISDVNLTGDDCQFYGQAYVDDDSGINQVRFYYNNGQGWAWILMNSIGGGLFKTPRAIDDPSSGGMVSPPWTVEYYVIAVDASPQMNETNSGSTSKSLMGCGG